MSETQQQAVAVRGESPRAVVMFGRRGLEFGDLDGMWRVANYISRSGLAPKGITTPEAILVAMQLGAECGLSPMAALQNIAVINGRPTLWGDAQLAVVRGTGELEEFDEWVEAGGKRVTRAPKVPSDDTTSVCRVKRKGYPAREGSFSVADAKTAGLWSKEGPWKAYPYRMLQMRARAFVLRDCFGDALRGMRSAEEMIGPVIDVDPLPDRSALPTASVELYSESGTDTQATATSPPVVVPSGDPAAQAEAKPDPKATQPADPSPQDRLMLYLQDYEITLGEFCLWGVDTGNLPAPVASWDQVAAETAMRLWPARKGIASAIKAKYNKS